jgi:hypothetical protein
MSQKLVVVVAEGTGKKGGAVVKSLLEQGHTWGISRTMFGIRRVRGGCSPSVGCNYYSVSASDADWTSSEHLARILHVMVPHLHAAFFRGFTESHFDRGRPA